MYYAPFSISLWLYSVLTAVFISGRCNARRLYKELMYLYRPKTQPCSPGGWLREILRLSLEGDRNCSNFKCKFVGRPRGFRNSFLCGILKQ